MAADSFERGLESLAQVYDFAERVMTDAGIEDGVRFAVQLALEELFTNMVKYNGGSGRDIRLEIDADDGEVAVTLTDFDVERFDVTRPRDAGVTAPLEQRKPGGLGLHLVQHMVDSLEYDYRDRRSRIHFTKGPA